MSIDGQGAGRRKGERELIYTDYLTQSDVINQHKITLKKKKSDTERQRD